MPGSPAKDASQQRVKPKPDPDGTASGIASVPHTHVTNPEPVSGCSDHLEKLISSSSVSVLEAAKHVGLRVVEDLKALVKPYQETGNPQVANWLRCIQQLEQKAKPDRTVVGVIGATGAGKSSLINALLDEERLVPTSGMRACTASATEISYNHSDDPDEFYRAEVEFISEEDWASELKTILGDLIDSTGNISPDCYNPDTDAGLAYNKIRAVYPKKTRERIASQAKDPSSSLGMAREPQVHVVLGSVKRLRASSSSDLFEALQQYIDSKENKKESKNEMEFWPLIKVVRVYCKAPALSTGVVIVDLPGFGDTNAARAAVSENYMKACDGIWITAEIQRAINNKTAKQLLGDSFKRQLKYDGAFSAVTFICTKVDDILMTEVQDKLNSKDEVGNYWKEVQLLSCKREQLTSQIESLKKQKNEFDELLEDLDLSNEQWEGLLSWLADGKVVYPPSDISKKRKRETSPSDEVDAGLDDARNTELGHASEVPQTPLTEDDINNVLATNKTHEREARKSKRNLDKAICQAEQELSEAAAEEAKMQSKAKWRCIQGRSQYVKDAMKRDFVLGIKELDQEASIEEDEANFDPEEESRDYDALARDLPVFCVSSRAFQKMAGRLENDTVQTDGFESLEDTGIPQLQEHAKRLTEGRRKKTCQLFLNELNQLLNSARLWSAGSERPAATQKKPNVDDGALHDLFMQLEDGLREAVVDCKSSMEHDLRKHLYKSFDTLIPTASNAAVGTATGWGKSRADGGLWWGTYKATCRREGSWRRPAGGVHHDFNAELFEPINRQLARSWERVFQRRIPQTLRAFAEDGKSALESFYSDFATKVPKTAMRPAELKVLDQQKRIYQTMLGATPDGIGAKITERQREASRGFTPVIQAVMRPAYDGCVRDRGAGTFVRMKSIMENHVESNRNTMFRKACDSVQAELDSMCAGIEESLTVFLQDLLAKLRRDSLATLAGGRTEASAEISPTERNMRDQMRPILDGADARFAEFCFAAAEGSETEESLIAQQLQDGMTQHREDVPNETDVKSENV